MTSNAFCLSTQDAPSERGELVLVIFGSGGVTRFQLPRAGSILIGRSEQAALQIGEPWISREHARLTVGEREISLEDLGSSNGTRVRKRPVRSRRVSLALGDTFELGSTLAVLARAEAPAAGREVTVDRAAFDARLRDLCATEGHRRVGLSVLALLPRTGAGSEGHRAAAAALCAAAQGGDSLSVDDDGVHWMVLTGGLAQDAPRVVDRFRHALTARGFGLDAATASVPREAHDATSAIALARARLGAPGAAAWIAPHVVESESMVRVRTLSALSADGADPVVVGGEPGVGKRVVAGWVHALGARAPRPLVDVDAMACDDAALALAARGSVVVRGVDEASLPQLRDLVLRARSHGARCVLTMSTGDSRRAGAFARELGASDIWVPPLRERAADLEPLARQLLVRAFAASAFAAVPQISTDAVGALSEYAWPENVRELAVAMFVAAHASGGAEVTAEHLPSNVCPEGPRRGLRGAVEQVERSRVADALASHGGNQARAARALGIARNTLISRMRRFGL
jgi:hypothetical protein